MKTAIASRDSGRLSNIRRVLSRGLGHVTHRYKYAGDRRTEAVRPRGKDISSAWNAFSETKKRSISPWENISEQMAFAGKPVWI